MDETVLLRIGRVIKTHGVVGAILVAPDSEVPGRLLDLDTVFLGASRAAAKPFHVVSSNLHKVKKHTGVVFRLKDVLSIDVAQTIVGSNVYASDNELPPLDDESFYLDDLKGMSVIQEDGRVVGKVREWLEYPSQIMLVIDTEAGDALVPLVIPHIVQDVDTDSGVITLQEWEGLIDG